MIAQQITYKIEKYKDNEAISDVLAIIKQMNESLDIAIIKVNAALVKLEKLESSRLYVEPRG